MQAGLDACFCGLSAAERANLYGSWGSADTVASPETRKEREGARRAIAWPERKIDAPSDAARLHGRRRRRRWIVGLSATHDGWPAG